MQKRKLDACKRLIVASMVVFIAINVICGKPSQATPEKNLKEVSVESEEVVRDELDVIGPTSIFWKDDKDLMALMNVNEITKSSEETEQAQNEQTIVESEVIDESVDQENTANEKITEVSKTEEAETEVVEEMLETKIRLQDITKDSDTNSRIRAILGYLIDEGFTPEAAAGVVGNIAVESCFNPSAITNDGYYGLFQWNTSSAGEYWWYKIDKWLSSNGYEWNSFEGQVRAFVECSNRGQMSKARYEELKKLKNVEQATELMAVFYEGCVGGEGKTKYYYVGTNYQALNTRKNEAWIAYEMYKDLNMNYTGEKSYSK